jgi:methylenetetrahydrofolate dehydrogenase (NADP+)/methenyltetrahydrofolate cyclohydrolase
MPEITTLELNGKPVAEQIFNETSAHWKSIAKGVSSFPCLASIAIGADGPFRVYQRQQKKAAERMGILFREMALPQDSTNGSIREELRRLNDDPAVSGILLQHPLPKPLDFFSIASTISETKDVDGVGALSLGRLTARRPIHVPAVALAALDIMKHYHLSPSGKRVVVLGRSETVGLPAALLLLMKGEWGDATVTVAHSLTRNLDDVVREGEMIVPCTGRPGVVNRENVAKGAAIVDIGISTVPDPTKPSGVRVAGDADPVSLSGWAGALTPVPGGVGPVTVAELMKGTVLGWEIANGKKIE